MECASCDGANLIATFEDETLRYGVGNVCEIPVRIPVYHCEDCGFSFTDQVTEYVHGAAIRQHLANCGKSHTPDYEIGRQR